MRKLSQDDIGILCICAIRYCHGRQTYMPSLIRGIVKPLLPELSDRDIGVMLADCEFQEHMDLYGDEKIDKPGWLEWREAVTAEAKRRNSH